MRSSGRNKESKYDKIWTMEKNTKTTKEKKATWRRRYGNKSSQAESNGRRGSKRPSVYLVVDALLRSLLSIYRRLVPGAHQTSRVEPGRFLKIVPADVGLARSFSQLRRPFGDVFQARVKVHEDGKIHLRLQTGGGADRHAGTLALDAQVRLPHAGQWVALQLLLWADGGRSSPVSRLLLGQVRTLFHRAGFLSLHTGGTQHGMGWDGT